MSRIVTARLAQPAASTISPATKLVRLDGSSTGLPRFNGLLNYNTWQAAIDASVGNDVIEGQSSTTWTGAPLLDFSNRNFTAQAPLIVRLQQGATMRFTGNNVTVNFNNSSYITLDWSLAHLKIGDSDLSYTYPPNGAINNSGLPGSSQQNAFKFQNSHHIRLSGPAWETATKQYGGRFYAGGALYMSGDCHHIFAQNLDMYLDGANNGGNAQGLQTGDIADMDGTYVLFVNCRFLLGGHDTVSSACVQSIYDGCVFGQNWRPFNSTYIGTRCSAFSQDSRSTGMGTPDGVKRGAPYGPCLFWRCQWKDAGQGIAGIEYHHTKMSGFNNILLGNYFFDNTWGPAMVHEYLVGTDVGQQILSYLRAAHNTFYGIRGICYRSDSTTGGSNGTVYANDFESLGYCNNIFAELNQNNGSHKAAVYISATATPLGNSAGGTWRNSYKGGFVHNNLFTMTAGAPLGSGGADQVNQFGNDAGFTQSYTLDSPPAGYSSVDPGSGRPNIANNIRCTIGSGPNATRIDFSNVGTLPDRQSSGFTLTGPGTAAVGTAPAMTFATANSTGTVVTVNDPWFANSPSLGIAPDPFIPELSNYKPYFGFGPDAVTAAANIRQVVGINTTTKQLTLSSSVSVNNGDQVWFAGFDGAKLWTNYGAAQ